MRPLTIITLRPGPPPLAVDSAGLGHAHHRAHAGHDGTVRYLTACGELLDAGITLHLPLARRGGPALDRFNPDHPNACPACSHLAKEPTP